MIAANSVLTNFDPERTPWATSPEVVSVIAMFHQQPFRSGHNSTAFIDLAAHTA
jgi:hypothetical protein